MLFNILLCYRISYANAYIICVTLQECVHCSVRTTVYNSKFNQCKFNQCTGEEAAAVIRQSSWLSLTNLYTGCVFHKKAIIFDNSGDAKRPHDGSIPLVIQQKAKKKAESCEL